MLLTLIWLFFGHFVADFVLQKRAWGVAKSSSNLALSKHVGTYTAALFLFALVSLEPMHAVIFSLIQGVTHWIIDWCTSRVTTQLYKEEKFHLFFTTIGYDQWLHVSVMLLTLIGLGY